MAEIFGLGARLHFKHLQNKQENLYMLYDALREDQKIMKKCLCSQWEVSRWYLLINMIILGKDVTFPIINVFITLAHYSRFSKFGGSQMIQHCFFNSKMLLYT